jgi:hypothetical protein
MSRESKKKKNRNTTHHADETNHQQGKALAEELN